MYHICMAKMEQNGLRLELGQKECFCTKYTVLGGFFLLWIVFGWPPSPIQFYLKFNLGSGQWKVHGEIQLEEIVDARFQIHLQRTHCPGHWVEFQSQTRLLFQFQNYMERAKVRDGRPAPRGRGGSPPRPALWGGGGSPTRPSPPRKNDQNRGDIAGQNKGPNLNFLQQRKPLHDANILQH